MTDGPAGNDAPEILPFHAAARAAVRCVSLPTAEIAPRLRPAPREPGRPTMLSEAPARGAKAAVIVRTAMAPGANTGTARGGRVRQDR
ncbi:hypothetical protein DLJ49_04270 [Rhodovulum sp. 12E13]|nr:hypothetical protein DLJ49_04270 [Rhodovulum sp. 12E13]